MVIWLPYQHSNIYFVKEYVGVFLNVVCGGDGLYYIFHIISPKKSYLYGDGNLDFMMNTRTYNLNRTIDDTSMPIWLSKNIREF
jgi:hypothetical protein